MDVDHKKIIKISFALVFIALVVVYFGLYSEHGLSLNTSSFDSLKWDNFLGLTVKAIERILEF